MKRAALLLLLALPALPAGAFHAATCTDDASESAIDIGGQVLAFTSATTGDSTARIDAILGDGPHSVVVAPAGDAEVAVCEVGAPTGQHGCTADNAPPVPDACSVSGPGHFVIYVRSKQPPGYPTIMPFAGVVAPA